MAISEAYRAALDDANKARAELGLPPVKRLYKGIRGDPNSCPITNTVYDDDLDRQRYKVTTGGVIYVTKYARDREAPETHLIPLSDKATEFVLEFDKGSKHRSLAL